MCRLRHVVLKHKFVWNVTGFKIHVETMVLKSFVLYIKAPHVNVVYCLHIYLKRYFYMRNKHVMHEVDGAMKIVKVLRVSLFVVGRYEICKFGKFNAGGVCQ